MSQILTSEATGARRVPVPRLAAAASTFNGVYLRPNLSNGGTIPASDPICTSPDIWIAGTTPVANFQTALATSDSYAQESSSNVTAGYDNYIYVRAMNGAASNQQRSVQLYYAPNAIIQWPSMWQSNVILTDQGNQTANLPNLAPGQIGVADQTFLWPHVPQPTGGSDHYCLFAQLNDANNSNPFPSIGSQVDMAALVRNNLAWGWRNTTMVPGTAYTWEYQVPLTIQDNLPDIATYYLQVNPTGFIGWTVWFTCSQADHDGKTIQLVPTQIQQDGALLGTTCRLAPGFNAVVTVYMQANGASSAPGAQVPLICHYATATAEVEEAVRRGVVDWRFNRLLQQHGGPGIGPTPFVSLGAYNFHVTR